MPCWLALAIAFSALGILGGPEAKKALEYLASNDPNISVRGEARRALKAMAKAGRHGKAAGK